MGRPRKISNIYDAPKSNVQFNEGQKSKGLLDDFAERQNINTKEGTVEHIPTADNHIANKKYVDDNAGGAPEGTAVKSTGEGGGTKFLREDGDDTCSWQAAAGANHAILDGSVHTDSVADAVTRGSLIYGNATPKWDELVIGADNTFLASDGTDASWAAVKLNELANPDGNTAFTMTTRQIKFTFTNPAVGDGAFEIEASGAFSGDLIHVHQHTGNPGAVDLIHAEADDADVVCLRLDSNGGTALTIPSGKVIFTPGTASEILSLNASKELTSLAVATYPSLTELSYVKGLTSAAQTQITANTTHAADNTQAHTDYLLNSGADVAVGPLTTTADNSSADTAYVPMVLYNTDDTPPAANGFPIGTLYVEYTA